MAHMNLVGTGYSGWELEYSTWKEHEQFWLLRVETGILNLEGARNDRDKSGEVETRVPKERNM